MLKIYLYFIITASLFSGITNVNAQEDLEVFTRWRMYKNLETSLYDHISTESFKLIKSRKKETSKLKSKSDWIERQKFIKKTLNKIIGPFPDKNPLNARTIETVQKNGFRYEKVLFESQPGFLVTGILYIPDNLLKKAPAILYCAGHYSVAYRAKVPQEICLNFVKKGFVVFAFDPADQGERQQYWEPELGGNLIGRATQKHSYVGSQCFITGSSLAKYFVWDGIRSIDYLVSRNEVDPNRIGVTGASGGGMQTAYISALDERVLAAAPANWITTRERILQSIGPQDAEQNLFHELANGLDVADLLIARAPKPTLIITTSQDFFNINGSIEVEEEVKQAYKAFEKENLLMRIEDYAPHEYTDKNKEETNRFFQKYLNNPGDPKNINVETFPASDLNITKNGILCEEYETETVFSLNKIESNKYLNNLKLLRESNLDNHVKNTIESAKSVSGYRKPAEIDDAVLTGRFLRKGYSIEKYFINGEGDYPIPFLLFLPERITSPPIIYLDEEGKKNASGMGEIIEWFVKQGHPVVALDLLGVGEVGSNFTKIPGNSKFGLALTSDWFQSVLYGRSITGIHAGDISRIVMFLQKNISNTNNNIYAIATGILCPSLLHAAAIENSISRIALLEPIISYGSILTNKYYNTLNIYTAVPGAIQKYDLPDLEASLAPRKLLMIDILDHLANKATSETIDSELKVVMDRYKSLNSSYNLEIKRTEPYQEIKELFISWIE